MKNILLASTFFGSLMIVSVATGEIRSGSACVAEGEPTNKAVIGPRGEFLWKDTTQSKRVHCPVISSQGQIFAVVNTSNGSLTCTIKSLLARGAGLQSGGYTTSSKKEGSGAARLRVIAPRRTNQTVGYVSYCNLPAAKGTHRGAASRIFYVGI